MILIIDGNSILNRAFFAIRTLTAKDGLYTNAVYGFLLTLESIRDEVRPDGIAVAFDERGKTFRHEMYEGYKAGRKGMPEELAVQLPYAKRVLEALGCEVVSCPGFEADDILGTYSAACEKAGEPCVIATGDRDALQLVGEYTRVRIAKSVGNRPENVLYDSEKVRGEYLCPPERLIDIKALMGDQSDNIPGVPGIGEKTAVRLISRFGSLDGVYENLASPFIKDGERRKLTEGRESAYLSLKLGTIDRRAPVAADIEGIKARRRDDAELRRLLIRLEFFRFLKKYGLETAPEPLPQAAPAEAVNCEQTRYELLDPGERACILNRGGTWWVCRGGKYAECSPRQAEALLTDPSAPKAVYDIKKLCREFGGIRVSGEIFDLLLAAYLVNPLATDYSFERICAEYASDTEGLADPARFSVLCGRLEAAADGMGMGKLLRDIEQPLAQVLAKMELEGVSVDGEALEKFGEELSADAEALKIRIYMLAGKEFNINSPRQLGGVLFGDLGLYSPRRTKSGYSTDAETLEKLRGDHPVVDLVLEYRRLAKLKSTYCEGLSRQIGPDGRIRTTFIQTETRTGRISSAEPNLQNIPVRTELGSRMRGFFTAPRGRVLIDADYSQIELRVLAALSGDENMISAFERGDDIHAITASQVFGLPLEMVTPELRSRAKAVNFGIVYGIGAFSLAKNVGVSVKDADAYIKSYLAAYPGVARYLGDTVKKARENGYVTTFYGRRRPLPELASSNANIRNFGERAAKNTAIQGTAADIIKIAMIGADRELAARGLDAKLILQVHDELIVECAENDAEAAAAVLKNEMESAASLRVKLTADVRCGRNWLEAKS